MCIINPVAVGNCTKLRVFNKLRGTNVMKKWKKQTQVELLHILVGLISILLQAGV